jgi:glycine/D-amino acid oxidase-like deaminating enzyme
LVGVSSGGAVEPAGAVVVAAGPWTPAVVDPSRAWQPMVVSWGVVASIVVADAPRHGLESIDIDIEPGDDDPDGPAPADGAAGDVHFSLIPAIGSSALGSTFLAAEPVPEAWVDRLRRLGARYVPAVADAPLVGLRHCARPVSLDGRPLVGGGAVVRRPVGRDRPRAMGDLDRPRHRSDPRRADARRVVGADPAGVVRRPVRRARHRILTR